MTPLRDVRYVAERLGVSASAVYKLVAARRLPFVRIGMGDQKSPIRFLDEDIDAFIAARRVGPPQAPVEARPVTSTDPRRPKRPAPAQALPGEERYL